MKISPLLALTALFSGLMAGLFFAFTVSVMPGLKKLADADFIKAMQAINRAIQNPVFFLVFFGILVLLPLSTFQQYAPGSVPFRLLLAASLVYFIGVFGVTVLGNVPLNNQLEAFKGANENSEPIHRFRLAFETAWNFRNTVRTLASLLSFALVVVACLVKT